MPWYFVLFLIYSTMLCLMVLTLVKYHVGELIVYNLTTNEQINVKRYTYLHNEFGHFSNPFDKGTDLNNFWDGLFPSDKVFFTRDEVIQHRRTEEVGENGKMSMAGAEEEQEGLLHGDVKARQ